MNNYTIVKINHETIPQLYTLFESVYKKRCLTNYYELKYNTRYTGVEYIGFLAFHNNIPVAFYGVIPTIVSINKKAVLAAQSCDTMTHPDYQKKGLFVELAKQTFDFAKQSGIHFIFGFPNQNSFPTFIKKLGFTHMENMNRYTFHFSNNIYKILMRKFWFVKSEDQCNDITNVLIEEGFDGILYNKAYLDYKKYNANTIVKSKETTLWINMSKGGWIGTLLPLTKDNFRIQIQLIENLTKASSITFMVSSSSNLNKVLSQNAKPESGFAVITKNLSNNYNLNNLKFQFSDVDVF